MDSRLASFRQWLEFVHPLEREGWMYLPLTVFIGPQASGKTALVQHWIEAMQAQEPNPPTILVMEALKDETPPRFFRRLLRQLGAEEPKRQSFDELMQTLRETMLEASVDLVVIDRGENLNLALLDCLRGYLFDAWGISLLLVGQPKLLKTCKRDESFESRISAVHSIEQFDPRPAKVN